MRLAEELDPTVTLPKVALAVNVPPVTFERPVTVGPARLVVLLELIEANVPPVAFSVPEVFVVPTVPAEIFAVPASPRVRLPRFAAESSRPPVMFARLVTEPAVSVDVPAVTFNELKTHALSKVPAVFTRLAVPPVRLAVALEPTVKFPSVALAVNVPPVTFDRPVTVAPVKLVLLLELIEANVPPEASSVPETLVTPTVPAEISAAPAAPTVRLPRLAAESSKPPVMFARLVTDPAVRVAVPAVTVRELRTEALSKVPAVITTFAVAPVRLAVADDPTVRLPKVALAVNVPAVTFDRPVTVAPVRSVMLLEVIDENVPPVAFNVPEVFAVPMVPAEISAVPAAPTVRLPRFAAESSKPPVMFARFVTDPVVRVAVPAVTFNELKTEALSKVPDVFTTLAVPPVRLAVADDPTVRLPKVALAVNVPPVTFERPVTVEPVRSVMLLEVIDENVPPVAFNVPDVLVAPMVPAEILAVPALSTFRVPRLTDETSRPPVTLARFVTFPPVSVVVPAETASELRTAVLLRTPAEFTTLADPAVRLAVAPEATVRLPRTAAFVVKVPAVTFDRPVTFAVLRLVVLLELIEANVPPVAFRVPELSVAPTDPAEILAVPALPTVRVPMLTAETSSPPVTLARFVTDPPVSVEVPAETASELRTAVLLRTPAEFTTLADPAVRLAVAPEATVRLPRTAAFVVKVPAVIFDRPVTLAGVRLVRLLELIEANVPPVAFRVPEVLVTPTIPAEILAVPALPTVRLPRLTAETSRPPVTLARFATTPPVRVEVPAETASEFRTAVLLRTPAELTTPADPPVRLAVAPEATVRLPRMAAFVVNVPAVTFDSPVTLAGVRFVVLLELIEVNVPPVAFRVPELSVAPTDPAEILAVPALPTFRVPRLTDDTSSPPVTLARFVTDPPVRVEVPAETASELRTAVLLMMPAEFTTFAVPPVRLAVAPEATVRSPRVAAFVVKVPAVTFESPVTLAGVRFVILLELIEANVPPVAFRVPEVLVAPTVPDEILAVPAFPTVRLPRLTAETSSPPVTLASPST